MFRYTNHRFYGTSIHEFIIVLCQKIQINFDGLIVESICHDSGKKIILNMYIFFFFFVACKRFINVYPWDGNIRLSSSRRKLCINGSVPGAPQTRPDR